jgi:putative DNA primase/helicase
MTAVEALQQTCDYCCTAPATGTLAQSATCDQCNAAELTPIRHRLVKVEEARDAAESTTIKTSTPQVSRPDLEGPMAGVDGYRYTDRGNAERLLAQSGEVLRYVPLWRRWLTYDGTRWRLDYADTSTSNLAAKIGSNLIEQVGDVYQSSDKLKPLLAHVKRCESAAGIVATLQVASSVPGVAIDHETLDAEAWLLNVGNGTIDLRTGQMRPHDPSDLMTMIAAVDYDRHATWPEWERFLERVIPDDEVRYFVQRLAGLALVGAQLEHMLPICLGGGANGKSTMTKVLADVLGDYAIVASRDVLLAMKHDSHPTAKADLFRKRFAHSGELPAGAKLDEAQVKELTGGDRIKARRMREDHWEFDPSHLLWLHANHRPTIEGTDDGIWRRVLLIPFDVQVPPEDRDPHLAGRIVTNEGSGVLRWALEGLADYRKNGLRIPPIVAEATRAYRGESDTVSAFLSECSITIDPNSSTDSSDLIALHGEWFVASGSTENEGGHYQRVISALKKEGVTTAKNSRRGRYWRGVAVGGDGV